MKKRGIALLTALAVTAALFAGISVSAQAQRTELVPYTSFDTAADGDKGNRGNANAGEWKMESGDTAAQLNEWVADSVGGHRKYSYPAAADTSKMQKVRRLLEGFDTLKTAGTYTIVMKARMAYTPSSLDAPFAEWGLATGGNAGDSKLRLMRIYKKDGTSNYIELMSNDGSAAGQKTTVVASQAGGTWNDTIIVIKADGNSNATVEFFINGIKYSDKGGTPFTVTKTNLEAVTGPRLSANGGNIVEFDDVGVYGLTGGTPAFEVAAAGVNGGTLDGVSLTDDVTVAFTNEIYAAAFSGKVKLYKVGEGEQIVADENIKVNPDQKSISISHEAFEAGGEYTLDLTGAADIFGEPLSGTTSYNLTAMEGFAVSSFNGGKTDKIGLTEEIGLQFSVAVSPSNLYGKLTIQKEGQSPETVTDENITADGAQGVLISGNQFDVASTYTLTIADDVVDDSGQTISASTTKSFAFTTRPAAFETVKTDFSAMEKEAQPVNEPGFVFSEKEDTLRIREANGKKFMEVRGVTANTTKNQDPNFRVTLPQPMSSYGDYQTTTLKMKIAGNANSGANMRIRYCKDSGGTSNQMTMLALRSGTIGVCDYSGGAKDQTDGSWTFADGVTYTISMRTNFAAHTMDISISGDDGANYSLADVDINYDKMHTVSGGTPSPAWTGDANSIEFYFAGNNNPIFADVYELEMHDNFPDFEVAQFNSGTVSGVPVDADIPVTFTTPLRAEDLFGLVSLQKGDGTPAVLTNSEIVQTNGSGITVSPAAVLDYGTAYRLIFDAAAADRVGMKLSGTREFIFQTENAPFTVSDFNGGTTTDIGLNANLTLAFSTPVAAAALANQITLQKQGGTAVDLDASRIVQNGNNGVTITGNTFDASSAYTLTLKNTATDANGTEISGTKTFTFTTGAALAAFQINSFNAGKTEEIGWNDDITIVFTTEVNKANLSGKLKLQAQGGQPETVPDSRIVQDGASGIKIIGNTFAKATVYTVTVDPTAEDNAGTAFSDTNIYSFTTKDDFTVQSFNGGKVTDVELDGDITLAFSTKVEAANLVDKITLQAGGAAEPIPAARIAQVDAKTVKVTGNQFAPSTQYTLEIAESAADNTGTPISDTRSFQFATKAAFLVVSFNGGNTAGVSLNAALTLQFSTEVDVSRLYGKITLQKGNGTAILVADAKLAQVSANTVSVSHDVFEVESSYTLAIAGDAKDNGGRTIQPPLQFAFTTQKAGMNRYTDFSAMTAGAQPTNGNGFTFSEKNATIRVMQEDGEKFLRVVPTNNDDPNFRVTAPQKFSEYNNKIVLFTKMKLTAEETSSANMRMRYCIDSGGTKNQLTLLAIKNGQIGIGDYAGAEKDKTDGTWRYKKNTTYEMTFVMDFGASPKMDVTIAGDDGSLFTVKNAGINFDELMTAASGDRDPSWTKDANSIEFYYGKSGTPISTDVYSMTLREVGAAGFVSATPADGSQNVAADGVVTLQYNNVVSLAGAQAGFTGSDGKVVPANLSLSGFGGTVTVRPQKPLFPGETYTFQLLGLHDLTETNLNPVQLTFSVKPMNYQAVVKSTAGGQVTLNLVNTTDSNKTMLILTAKCTGTVNNYMVGEIAEQEVQVAAGTTGQEYNLPVNKGEASFVKIVVLDSTTHQPVMYVPAVVQ